MEFCLKYKIINTIHIHIFKKIKANKHDNDNKYYLNKTKKEQTKTKFETTYH